MKMKILSQFLKVNKLDKKISLFSSYTFIFFIELATESIRSDSVDSTNTIENEQQSLTIKCDSCQEIFLTSEQFNQHRLYQCSFLTGNIRVINH